MICSCFHICFQQIWFLLFSVFAVSLHCFCCVPYFAAFLLLLLFLCIVFAFAALFFDSVRFCCFGCFAAFLLLLFCWFELLFGLLCCICCCSVCINAQLAHTRVSYILYTFDREASIRFAHMYVMVALRSLWEKKLKYSTAYMWCSQDATMQKCGWERGAIPR